jgi:hypothetical protein
MKPVYSLPVILLYLFLAGCNERSVPERTKATDVVRVLDSLLTQKDFFRLEKALDASAADVVSIDRRLYYKAFLNNAFNRNEQAVGEIDTLLARYAPAFSDSATFELRMLKGDSYFKLFRYAEAAQSCQMALAGYGKQLDSERLGDIKNSLLIRNALKNSPPQTVSIRDSALFHWKRDRIGLIEIPVKTHFKTYDAVFDTRANISSITQSYAKLLGVKMLDVSYEEASGMTGIKFKTGLGIADSLYLGDILVRNAVFQVMPDSILYIAPLGFSLNIIIGYPVIEQLREIHIFKDGRMTVPLKQTESSLHNFALDGLNPVIALGTGNDTLSFHFDLGANTTTFYKAYFVKYRTQILQEAKKKTVGFGGAGGIEKKQVYRLPRISLSLGDRKVPLDSVDVLTEKIFPEEKLYGNVGQDFVAGFRELILNFNYMYVDGK